MAQPLQAPLPGYSPYQQDVLALMNNQFKAQTLGNISAIRRRVIKLLCPVHPRHEGFCLAVLHTLHDALFGLPTQASTEPLSHYATANAILTFTGLPALGSKAREQQLRKRAKDVLLCCTDRALALLLNTLSLGPPEVHHEAVRGWRGRVDRISAIAAASDFLAQPTPQACAAHAAAAADSALCGSLPRRGEAAAAPVRHEPTPEAEECPILAVLSGRSGYVGGSPGPSEGAATPPCACSTPVEPPDVYMGGDVEDAAVPLPPPESVPASRRATDGSFAEASAAAEILTQLVGAARAAQSRPRGDGSGLEGAPLGGPAWGEFGEGPARAEASSPFVVEVLEEARRALDDIRSSSQHTAHAEESGAASSVAGLPDEGDAVGGAPAGAAAGETPTRPKKVRRVKMARGTEVGESAAEMGGVVGSAANWTEPETPEAAGMGAQRPGGAAGTAAAGMPASAWGRRARGEAGGGQGHVGANEGGRRAGEGEPAGACAAGGSGVLLWDAGSRGGSGDGTSGPAWETVRWQEVARGHGCELRGIARLWASVAACEEREPAAQLLHKALTGVPGRNKKIRLQTLSGFCGLAKAVGQGGGVRPETHLATARQCISTATVQPHVAAVARLLVLPEEVRVRASDKATVQFAIDYILDFLVSPSPLYLADDD